MFNQPCRGVGAGRSGTRGGRGKKGEGYWIRPMLRASRAGMKHTGFREARFLAQRHPLSLREFFPQARKKRGRAEGLSLKLLAKVSSSKPLFSGWATMTLQIPRLNLSTSSVAESRLWNSQNLLVCGSVFAPGNPVFFFPFYFQLGRLAEPRGSPEQSQRPLRVSGLVFVEISLNWWGEKEWKAKRADWRVR